MSLSTCAGLYESLQQYVANGRDQFDKYENNAKDRLPGVVYRCAAKRVRIRKQQSNDGDAPEHHFSPRDKFRFTAFLPIVDALSTNLQVRARVYKKVASQFNFITQLDLPKNQRDACVMNLVNVYSGDIDNNLAAELEQFHQYVKARSHTSSVILNAGKLFKYALIFAVSRHFLFSLSLSFILLHAESKKVTMLTHQQMYAIIIQDGIQCAFPNIEVLLRTFLCLMVTNCSGERSFSKLKRTKDELRSTMAQERLASLSLLSIEHEVLRSLTFDDIIDDFALAKSRKQVMQ